MKIEKGLNDTCPSLSVYKETTMFDYEIMENEKVEDGVCFATVSGFENVTNGTVCLRDDYGVVRCMSCLTGCNHKKASEQARSIVSAGYANCYCFTDSGEKIHIIKKRPVPKSGSLAKAAGYGATSLVGTSGIGTAIFFVLKFKSKLFSKNKKVDITSDQNQVASAEK
ncbi:hypothetical protein MAR_000455 [Mya arenaria]|uniref:Uncharacterized protein n=2 Tax=Mya arenaria TaxID=6604 RepID=A0ABY7FAJ3_MYAAR|nr:hypothetical protein MAR_000455 [Mya arenaria]